jgi:uncharacterized protein YqgC (DUF456 family)
MMHLVIAIALICAALLAWLSTLVSLPGNWLILIMAAGFAWAFPADSMGASGAARMSLSWGVVGVLAGLAFLGEIGEFLAGSVGAARQGASRRAMVLSLIAAVVGSLLGAVIVSAVLPIIGTLLGALLGGCAGAFGGAYMGEWWKGRSAADRISVGSGAMVGRLLGTMSKFLVGAVMVAVLCVALLF